MSYGREDSEVNCVFLGNWGNKEPRRDIWCLLNIVGMGVTWNMWGEWCYGGWWELLNRFS